MTGCSFMEINPPISSVQVFLLFLAFMFLWFLPCLDFQLYRLFCLCFTQLFGCPFLTALVTFPALAAFYSSGYVSSSGCIFFIAVGCGSLLFHVVHFLMAQLFYSHGVIICRGAWGRRDDTTSRFHAAERLYSCAWLFLEAIQKIPHSTLIGHNLAH